MPAELVVLTRKKRYDVFFQPPAFQDHGGGWFFWCSVGVMSASICAKEVIMDSRENNAPRSVMVLLPIGRILYFKIYKLNFKF